MRIASKPALLTVPVVMFITLVAVLALWATGNIGGSGIGASSTGGSGSAGEWTWNVEYWHENADGDLLQYGQDHNTVIDNGLTAGIAHLLDANSVTVAGTQIADATKYDNIVLSVNAKGTAAPLVAGDIKLLVDGGDDGDNAGHDTDATHFNPADGLFATGAAGVGTVTNKFLAQTGVSGAILEMRLVKTQPDDSASTPVAIALADTLAVIGINVTLADTDTLTITWTVTFTAS